MSAKQAVPLTGAGSMEPSEPFDAGDAERSWLYDHIGRIAGIALGLLVVAVVAFLAVAGYQPATTLLVIIVAGFLIITVGGKMRGGR